MDKDEIETMLLQMDCGMAYEVLRMVDTVRSLGFDIPDELQPVYMAAIGHFMQEGYIEPTICEHGNPTMAFTDKFREVSESTVR